MPTTSARRSFRTRILPGLTAVLLVFCAPLAHADSLAFTGTLRVVFGPPGATLFDQTVSGSGTAEVSRSGGSIDAIAGLSAGAFAFAGPTFPITDPHLVPVVSIRLDASSGAGDFSGLTSGGGGTMGIPGQLFGPIAAGAGVMIRENAA